MKSVIKKPNNIFYQTQCKRLATIINSCNGKAPPVIVEFFCDSILSSCAGGRYKAVWKHLKRTLQLSWIHLIVKFKTIKQIKKELDK